MIVEDDQASTFSMMAEMLHTKVRREQLSSKVAVALLCWLQSFREESERLSMVTFSLVEDSTDRCLRGVNH